VVMELLPLCKGGGGGRSEAGTHPRHYSPRKLPTLPWRQPIPEFDQAAGKRLAPLEREIGSFGLFQK
jgi:hypothetical protein